MVESSNGAGSPRTGFRKKDDKPKPMIEEEIKEAPAAKRGRTNSNTDKRPKDSQSEPLQRERQLVQNLVDKHVKKYGRLINERMAEEVRIEMEKYGEKCKDQIKNGLVKYIESKRQGLAQIEELNSYSSS